MPNIHSSEKIVYMSFNLVRPGETWSSSVLPTRLRSNAAAFFADPATYLNCYFDLTEVDDKGQLYREWKGLRFGSVASMFYEVAKQFEENPTYPSTPRYNAIYTVYDIVDDSVPHVAKMYGLNRFYSSLRAPLVRDTHRASFDRSNSRWPSLDTWFAGLRARFTGIGSGPMLTQDEGEILWFPVSNRTLYGLPRPGFESPVRGYGTQSRNAWDTLTGTAEAVNWAQKYTNAPDTAGTSIQFCDLQTGATSWSWSDPDALRAQSHIMQGSSRIALYHMQHGTRHSVYIKPVGIDEVLVSWFDREKYDLYALHSKRGHAPTIIFVKPDSTWVCGRKSLIWLNPDMWAPKPVRWVSLNGEGRTVSDTRFFLRDRKTGNISRLTRGKVVLGRNHRYAPFKYEVCYD